MIHFIVLIVYTCNCISEDLIRNDSSKKMCECMQDMLRVFRAIDLWFYAESMGVIRFATFC